MDRDDAGVLSVAGERTRTMDRRWVTAALMLVMVLASMEQTVTSTAMPTIIGELHGFEHYAWVTSMYLLACTVSMPLYGRLADALGRKKVILGATTLFAAASVLAASAHGMVELIVYRGLQGLGAGGIMPVVLTILGDIFTLVERAKIQGLFSAIWGTASIAGPALGAFLVNTMGWRSIFFVNLPFGALGLGVLAWKYHDHEKPHSTELDGGGVALLAVSSMALLAAVSGGASWPWGVNVALGAVAVVTLWVFVRHENRIEHPILPPGLLANRAIGPSLVASGILGVGVFAVDVYVPLYVQGGQGGGAAAAASVITPIMLMWASSGVIAAPLVVRWGFRKTALIGAALVSVGFLGLLFCAKYNAPHWALTGTLAITGCGFGPASMSYLLAAQGAVAWQQRGVVTSGVQFFRTIGGAIGVGLLGTLFNVLIRPNVKHLSEIGVTPEKLLDPFLRSRLRPDVLTSIFAMISGGLIWVFAAMLVISILGIVVTAAMAPGQADHAVSRTEAMEAMAG
jgi:EmrB/QacA subfamily drug resistance transporter